MLQLEEEEEELNGIKWDVSLCLLLMFVHTVCAVWLCIYHFPGRKQSMKQGMCVQVSVCFEKKTLATGFCPLCAPGVSIDLRQQTWKTWGAREWGKQVEGERQEADKEKKVISSHKPVSHIWPAADR